MVFDITAPSLLGKYEVRVERAGCRRLNSKNKGSRSRYNEILEDHIRQHKLRERLDQLDVEIGNEAPNEEQIARFEVIDKQTAEIQLHAEKSAKRFSSQTLSSVQRLSSGTRESTLGDHWQD